MKTFEEALESLMDSSNPDLNLLTQNLIAGMSHIKNENFRILIYNLVDMWLDKMKETKKDDLYALACSTLHGVFQLGLLIGMDMEKSEDKIK